jgi:hypothetical protein
MLDSERRHLRHDYTTPAARPLPAPDLADAA